MLIITAIIAAIFGYWVKSFLVGTWKSQDIYLEDDVEYVVIPRAVFNSCNIDEKNAVVSAYRKTLYYLSNKGKFKVTFHDGTRFRKAPQINN